MNPQGSSSKSIAVKIFDFIDLHPSKVKNMFVDGQSNRIYISRQHYSEVCCYQSAQQPHKVIINQLCRLQDCEKIMQIDKIIVMVMPFELKAHRNGSWNVFPFTTQLLSVRYDKTNSILYTFHQKESVQWLISDSDGISMKYLQKYDIPYHITQQGTLEGFGKKVAPPQKGTSFTVLETSQNGDHIFVGSDNGSLYVYETKFLTNVKVIHRHEAPILAIKSFGNICFFSGSDSKISSLKLNKQNGQWLLGQEIRGQSHDILSLQISPDQKYVMSAGLTTDICFYQIDENKSMEVGGVSWAHKVSYASQDLVKCIGKYLIVNRFKSFEIWKQQNGGMQSSGSVSFLVKYDLPFHKNIKILKARYWDIKSEAIFIIVATQFQAITWIFTEQEGLLKHSTIKNSYDLLEFVEDCSTLITLRQGYKLENLDYRTGKIEQLTEAVITMPTSLKLIQTPEYTKNLIIISSGYQKKINVYEINSKTKNCSLIKEIINEKYFEFVGFYGRECLLIKDFGDTSLNCVNFNNLQKEHILNLPIKKIRYAGWFEKQMPESKKNKVFWYGVGEGKIVIVSNLKKIYSKKIKKIRVKQFPRIGTIVQNNAPQKNSWDIGVVPLNFKQHIKESVIKPIIIKKIE